MNKKRLEWLELALGLAVGTRYGGGGFQEGRPFEGVYIWDDSPTGKPETLGGATIDGPLDIRLNGKELRDPISQFVIGLHERSHLLAGDWRPGYEYDEEIARSHAIEGLAPALGLELATQVYDAVIADTLETLPDLPDLIERLWECQDQRLQPRYRLVVEEYAKWGKSIRPAGGEIPRRGTEGRRFPMLIHETGRLIRGANHPGVPGLAECWVAVETGEILGVVGEGGVR